MNNIIVRNGIQYRCTDTSRITKGALMDQGVVLRGCVTYKSQQEADMMFKELSKGNLNFTQLQDNVRV
jgi:hypothetical protein